MAVLEKFSNQCSILFSSESTLLLSVVCIVLQSKQRIFKGFFSRKANLLSFLMKKGNPQKNISAKKFVKETDRLQPRQTLDGTNIIVT